MIYDDEKIANESEMKQLNKFYNEMKGVEILSSNNKVVEQSRASFVESCLIIDGVVGAMKTKTGTNTRKKIDEFDKNYGEFKKHFNVDTQILGAKKADKNNYCGYVNQIYKKLEEMLKSLNRMSEQKNIADYKNDMEQICNLLRSINNLYIECKYKI